jgi:hypothetical protein
MDSVQRMAPELVQSLRVPVGDHAITLKKSGFAPWERKVKVTGGKIQITANLQAIEGTPTSLAQ